METTVSYWTPGSLIDSCYPNGVCSVKDRDSSIAIAVDSICCSDEIPLQWVRLGRAWCVIYLYMKECNVDCSKLTIFSVSTANYMNV